MATFTEWDDDLADALAEPFPPSSHSEKTQGGSKITFVDVHEYKDRLNATVGPQGWESSVRMESFGSKLVFVVRLTILGVTKENVGDEVEEPPVNERGNSRLVGSPCTNAYAQAFKRACSDFGLGAYLYDPEKRAAATRSRPRQAAPTTNAGQGGGGGRKATAKQMEYLDKLMKSSVFSDEERTKVGAKIATEDGETVSRAIEWAKEQVTARKEGATA